MKTNPEDIKNDVTISRYTIRDFIEDVNAIDELHMSIFQGYQGETGKAEAFCEHMFCEFVLEYLNMVTKRLVELHNFEQSRAETNKEK